MLTPTNMRVKIEYNDIIRVIAYPYQHCSGEFSLECFQNLENTVKQLLAIDNNTKISIFYEDSDNDKILMSFDGELRLAQETALHNNNTLRIFVQTTTNVPIAPAPQQNTVILNRIERIQQKIDSIGDSNPFKKERLLAKLAKVTEKAKQKQLSAEEREVARAERRRLKEEKKQNNLLIKKQQYEHKQFVLRDDINIDQDWPTNITKLYVDGNNCMFVTASIRNLIINEHCRWKAEVVFGAMTRALGLNLQLEQTHVMYDIATSELSQYLPNDERFTTSSAKPTYETADDGIVDIATQWQQQGQIDSCLFVTSDKGLRDRLKQLGGKCIKPKLLYDSAFKYLNTNGSYKNIDNMIKQLFM